MTHHQKAVSPRYYVQIQLAQTQDLSNNRYPFPMPVLNNPQCIGCPRNRPGGLEQSLGEVFLSIPSILLERGFDRIRQDAYTFDLHLNPVSRFHGADALGRSRDDHISR
jgi:hypothetical protein